MNILAVVFPGQSSQRIGMLATLAEYYPLVKKTFSEASEVLNYDIWKLTQFGPVNELNKTHHAQPAILTASVAIWRIWKQQGGYIPKIMAGHSLGEYSALVCAGAINLSSAVKLVMKRGMLMQETMPYEHGAMSAIIGLCDDIVLKFCKIAAQDQIVELSVFNAPGHVVISGHKEAVNRVNSLCKNAGAKYVFLLPISVPSHCILMKPMVQKFREVLEKVTIYTPTISVINNVDIRIERDPEAIRNALLRQLYTPIRWYEIIQYFMNKKIERLLEMGPGKILTGLIRSTASNIFSLSINDPISLSEAMKIYRS